MAQRSGWVGRVSAGLALVVPLAAAAPATSVLAEEPAFADRLAGDWNGHRTRLKDKGVEFGVVYTGETFHTVAGGLRRGTSLEGQLDVTVQTDLEASIGWRGARTHIRAFQIHNGGLTAADYAGALADPSNIDAHPATRLYTAWLEQGFGNAGSIRLGQLAADDEFFGSDTAAGLINSTFGWGNALAANLPSGGPAYPLATPGVRVQLNAADNVTILGGVFSGDPAGRDCYRDDPGADPQVCNKHGTTFSLSGGALWIGEGQYLVLGDEKAGGLKAAYKLGAWYHSGRFADQPFDGETHHGNWGLYGVIDQMILRGRDSSVSLFLRGGLSPQDRNLVAWYADAGVGIKGALPWRRHDTLTFGIAHAHISNAAAAADRDIAIPGETYPIRSGETALELSYQMRIEAWWTIQPDLQYIVRPGGGEPHPEDAAKRVGNALLVGVRSAINF